MLTLLRFGSCIESRHGQTRPVLKSFHPQDHAAHSSLGLRQGADNPGQWSQRCKRTFRNGSLCFVVKWQGLLLLLSRLILKRFVLNAAVKKPKHCLPHISRSTHYRCLYWVVVPLTGFLPSMVPLNLCMSPFFCNIRFNTTLQPSTCIPGRAVPVKRVSQTTGRSWDWYWAKHQL